MAKQKLIKENIISLLDLEDLDEQRKINIIKKATDLIQLRLFNRILSSLSKKKKEDFLEAVENEDEEKINSILGEFEEFEEALREEVLKVKESLKEKSDSLEV